MDESDLPWLRQLCLKRYSHQYEPEGTENWYRQIVLKNPLLFLAIRTDDAFLIQMLSCVPWTPADFTCNVVFICADEGHMWDALSLCRYGIDWAKRRRCTDWRLMGDTGYDLGPMARRLGAKTTQPRYVLKL